MTNNPPFNGPNPQDPQNDYFAPPARQSGPGTGSNSQFGGQFGQSQFNQGSQSGADQFGQNNQFNQSQFGQAQPGNGQGQFGQGQFGQGQFSTGRQSFSPIQPTYNAKKSSSSKPWIILASVVALALIAGGITAYLTIFKPLSAEDAAKNYVDAFNSQDWDEMYEAGCDKQKSDENEKKFKAALALLESALKNVKVTLEAGSVKTSGSTGSFKIQYSFNGASGTSEEIPLVKEGTKWKPCEDMSALNR